MLRITNDSALVKGGDFMGPSIATCILVLFSILLVYYISLSFGEKRNEKMVIRESEKYDSER